MLYWLRLRRIRIKEQKNMEKSNLKIFKKAIGYIYNSNLKYFEKEEALHQIMDIILESQSEHKSVDASIEDYEAFCKSIVKEYTQDKSILYTLLHYFQRSIINMLFMLVPAIIFLKILHPKMNTGITIYLLILDVGYAFILMPFNHTNKQRTWSSVIFFIATLWATLFFSETQRGTIIDSELINNTNIILMGLLLIVVAIEIYKRFRDKRYH